MHAVECRIRVRYSETGKMGFAHHANYFNWFDLAQEELLKKYGFGYSRVEEAGYKFLPVHLSCDFKSPVYYDDLITVRIFVKELKGIRILFAYEIVREKDAAVIAAGESAHILVDNDMKVALIQRALPDVYEIMRRESEG